MDFKLGYIPLLEFDIHTRSFGTLLDPLHSLHDIIGIYVYLFIVYVLLIFHMFLLQLFIIKMLSLYQYLYLLTPTNVMNFVDL